MSIATGSLILANDLKLQLITSGSCTITAGSGTQSDDVVINIGTLSNQYKYIVIADVTNLKPSSSSACAYLDTKLYSSTANCEYNFYAWSATRPSNGSGTSAFMFYPGSPRSFFFKKADPKAITGFSASSTAQIMGRMYEFSNFIDFSSMANENVNSVEFCTQYQLANSTATIKYYIYKCPN